MDPNTTEFLHLIADGFVCNTEGRGHATPGGRTPTEIVVDATEGFIPLWHPCTILKWRFQERSFALAADPNASQAVVVDLISEALLRWGSAAPVKFTRDTDLWDFEVVLRNAPDCTPQGCVLASAFFPDAGRHELTIYPTMFEQSREEQIETLIHELGHVFGLRHFFATVSETAWPSEVFGTHSPFSIMNLSCTGWPGAASLPTSMAPRSDSSSPTARQPARVRQEPLTALWRPRSRRRVVTRRTRVRKDEACP